MSSDRHVVLSGVGISRRFVRASLAVLLTAIAGSAIASAPAFAAPEVPSAVVVEGVTATTATVHGELNPGKAGGPGTYETGTYEFLYRSSGSECEGASQAPASAGMSLGEGSEKVSEGLSGLEPGSEYTVCLRIEGADGEARVGPKITFSTPAAPPSIDGESLAKQMPTSATLQAQINPNNQKTTYAFEYSTQASGETLEGSVTSIPGEGPLAGAFGDRAVSVHTGVLTPNTTYFYRVLATNGTPPTSRGKVERFVTPEAPIIESAVANGTGRILLKGELNPGGATGAVSYHFNYNSTNGTCTVSPPTQLEKEEGLAPVQQSTPAEDVAEGKEAHVQAEAQGLEPNKQYTVCLVATDTSGVPAQSGELTTQTVPAAPQISDEYVSEVSYNTANLKATIDTENDQISYYFEYGTVSAHGSQTATVSLSAAGTPVEVSAVAEGLQANTQYHFQAVVTNAAGETTRGAEATFSTLPPSAPGLPDGRVYEMVTPLQNDNAGVYIPETFFLSLGEPGVIATEADGVDTSRPMHVAPDGDSVAYVSGSTPKGGHGFDQQGHGGNENLARRTPQGGWTSADIEPEGYGLYTRFTGFENDLSTGVFRVLSAQQSETGLQPLSSEEPEAAVSLFARSNEGVNRPLFTHVPAGTSKEEIPVFQGGSADFSQLLFRYPGALTANAPNGGGTDLYDSVEGHLTLVNILPDGTPAENATFGGLTRDNAGEQGGEGTNGPALSGAISADGSRIFWTDLGTGDLYVREDATSSDAVTVQVDASQGPGASGGGRFLDATSDGSKVFFLDESRLTADSTAAAGEPDLYEYSLSDELGAPGVLSDLTVDRHAGEAANVQGVVGIGETGGYVYFVADGALAPGAAPQPNCPLSETLGHDHQAPDPTPTPCNLFVYHDGETRFIAALSHYDGTELDPYTYLKGSNGDWQGNMGHRTAEVSPDGRALVFMSDQSLTGYDNRPPGRSNGMVEVYVYEADSGALTCVSCTPSGEPPTAGIEGASGFLPISYQEAEMPRVISDVEGKARVFFDSSGPLVAQDTNGKQDAYEWEGDGRGGCHEASGCTYLLTGGDGTWDSWVLGASESGDDAFLITRDQLVPEDHSEAFNLFDARVGGVRPLTPPACTGTGCQGVPAPPPIFATPPSVTFAGVGNFAPPAPAVAGGKPKAKPLTRAQQLAKALKACGRQRKTQRLACDRRARKRYGPVKKATRTSSSAKGRK
jgi:hypothetical protein